MAPPNATWREMLAQAGQTPEVLKQPDVVRNIQNILAVNVAVCSSLGHPFLFQLQQIYSDMLGLYGCACRPRCMLLGLLLVAAWLVPGD